MLGQIVKFGQGDFERVGVVVGEYEHTWLGRVLMVRTAVNIAKDQQFDNVPVDKAMPATADDLLTSVEREKAELVRRIDEWARAVIAAQEAV